MKKLYIDCGTNLGQGYETISGLLNINDDWDVIFYEANTHCYDFLKNKYVKDNINIINKAVHDSNGVIKFYIPKGDNFSVSSTIHNDFHNSIENKIYDNFIEIEKIDLSDEINKLKDEYEIYLKLDVEGSEYDILEKMIENKTILCLKKLFVEFHNQYISAEKLKEYDLQNRKNKIMEFIEKNNINFQIWY